MNSFILNLNILCSEKVSGLYRVSRNAIHTSSYHGSISQSQLCTHTSHFSMQECDSLYVYILQASMYHTIHTKCWALWLLSTYLCAHAALAPCASRSLHKSSVKTLLSASYHPNVSTRVSQKNQKSEFCFATNPSGFHRLDEPPEKISAL